MRPPIRRPGSAHLAIQPHIELVASSLFEILYFLPVLEGLRQSLPELKIQLTAPSACQEALQALPFIWLQQPSPRAIRLGTLIQSSRELSFEQLLRSLASRGLHLPKLKPLYHHTLGLTPLADLQDAVVLDLPEDLVERVVPLLKPFRLLSLRPTSKVDVLEPSSLREKLQCFSSGLLAITSSPALFLARAFQGRRTLGVDFFLGRDYLAPLESAQVVPSYNLPSLLQSRVSRPVRAHIRYVSLGRRLLGIREFTSDFSAFLPQESTVTSSRVSALVSVGRPAEFNLKVSPGLPHIGLCTAADLDLSTLHLALFLDKLLVFSDQAPPFLQLVPQALCLPQKELKRLPKLLDQVLDELTTSRSLFVIPQTFGDAFYCRGIVGALSQKTSETLDVMTKPACAPFFLGDGRHVNKLVLYPSAEVVPFKKLPGARQLEEVYSSLYTPAEKLQCDPHYLQELRQNRRQFAQDYALQCGLSAWTPEPLPETPCPLPEKFITIQASSRVDSKEWDHFPALLEAFRHDFPDIAILQLGGFHDKPLEGALPYLGQPWTTVSYILRRTLLHIGVDSVLAHMSAAYGKKSIALYGGTDVHISKSLGPQAVHLAPTYPISDGQNTCHQACHAACHLSFKCINTIGIDLVLYHVHYFLKGDQHE